ncbi:MAG: DUF1501 domain-containing protein [bacterium]
MQRRQLLKLGAGGLAGLCLRSLATGIPAGLLAGPRSAWAQAGGVAPQSLILCTSPSGDPFNAHAPGCDVAGASAPPDDRLRRVNVQLGETRVRAAQPWAALPRAMRDRLAFVLHRTNVNAHPEHAKVMRLLGAAKGPGGNGEDMLVSLIARHTADALGTIQREPVNMGRAAMTYQGRVLGRVTPSQLVDLFAGQDAALDDLTTLRDQTLDTLYADLKQTGTRAQRDFLDQYARSQHQARQLGQSLGALLQGIPADPDEPNSAADQVRAAAAMASLRVAPAYVLTIPFGGDNHADPGLVDETEQTIAGIAAFRLLWDELVRLGLQDEVTVCQWNVFGRTFETRGNAGRNHNSLAHTAMILGPRVQPGLYGALVRQGDDWAAQGIDPRTGQGVGNGGIPPGETLASLGKTLCAAVGLDAATIDADIRAGQVIRAALA